ncbi:hypothetical protein HK100_012337 [Physocladia obscura]|uniref:Serine aminopeptidase S33 domain-containing protein n=1 Tax=Physocladia obscura TaxID=109957 RepID=A0AAD5T1N2_9FUNG|nr:hypothetical protein HK100_012337 [Physocladia obscura]
MFTRFASAGILVKAMDWRGHGRTCLKNRDAIKGYHFSYNQVFDDMLQLDQINIPDIPNATELPTFVFGHSMGGLVALSFVHSRKHAIPKLHGCIAQAPAIGVGNSVSAVIRLAVKGLGNLLQKQCIISVLEAGGGCSDRAVVEDSYRDPLNHSSVSLKLGKDGYDAIDDLNSRAHEFDVPLLLRHSVLDRFTDPKATVEFFVACGSEDKSLRLHTETEGLLHEVHLEPSAKNYIIRDYITWILNRAQPHERELFYE